MTTTASNNATNTTSNNSTNTSAPTSTALATRYISVGLKSVDDIQPFRIWLAGQLGLNETDVTFVSSSQEGDNTIAIYELPTDMDAKRATVLPNYPDYVTINPSATSEPAPGPTDDKKKIIIIAVVVGVVVVVVAIVAGVLVMRKPSKGYQPFQDTQPMTRA